MYSNEIIIKDRSKTILDPFNLYASTYQFLHPSGLHLDPFQQDHYFLLPLLLKIYALKY